MNQDTISPQSLQRNCQHSEMESVISVSVYQLIGHKKDVVCLDISEYDDNILCNKSENVAVHMWDTVRPSVDERIGVCYLVSKEEIVLIPYHLEK